MSESRKKYFQRPCYYTQRNLDFLAREGERRDPKYHGRRESSGIVRDALDFAEDQYPLFLTWLATRGNSATDGE